MTACRKERAAIQCSASQDSLKALAGFAACHQAPSHAQYDFSRLKSTVGRHKYCCQVDSCAADEAAYV